MDAVTCGRGGVLDSGTANPALPSGDSRELSLAVVLLLLPANSSSTRKLAALRASRVSDSIVARSLRLWSANWLDMDSTQRLVDCSTFDGTGSPCSRLSADTLVLLEVSTDRHRAA